MTSNSKFIHDNTPMQVIEKESAPVARTHKVKPNISNKDIFLVWRRLDRLAHGPMPGSHSLQEAHVGVIILFVCIISLPRINTFWLWPPTY